jgi:hypothetical protein
MRPAGRAGPLRYSRQNRAFASPGVLAVWHRRRAPDKDISSNRTVPVAPVSAGEG